MTVGCPTDAYGFKAFVYGNSGRNILDGPGLAYLNASLMKNFRFQERKRFQLRFESFNALNHPNFNLPNNQFNGSGAGLSQAWRTQGVEARVCFKPAEVRVLSVLPDWRPAVPSSTPGLRACGRAARRCRLRTLSSSARSSSSFGFASGRLTRLRCSSGSSFRLYSSALCRSGAPSPWG